jgi:threonine dehydratase
MGTVTLAPDEIRAAMVRIPGSCGEVAAKSLKPDTRIVRVEPAGAPTLHATRATDQHVELTSLAATAVTLVPRHSETLNFAFVRQTVERIVLVEDTEKRATTRCLWNEMGIAAGLSSVAAVAAMLAGHYRSCAAPQPMA